MPYPKKRPIASSKTVLITLSNANRFKLSDLEKFAASERNLKSVLDISNADIINDAINIAWEVKYGKKRLD